MTGADGFIGRNLSVRLEEVGAEVLPLLRDTDRSSWFSAVDAVDLVIHLAGSNRPAEPSEFMAVNHGTSDLLAQAVSATGRQIRVVYASTIRATEDSDYGSSKRQAEKRLECLSEETGSPVHILRLPNVFGKWARPNYNSAVATFCHNIARGLPVEIHDAEAPLHLVYIDDVVERILEIADGGVPSGMVSLGPIYQTNVGAVARTISGFYADRDNNFIDQVGAGLIRALYSTYVSYLPKERFSYPLKPHNDRRGSFSEVLKTRTSGQFSYFTAHPGVTRGGHYHHTKTEKFLIVNGRARFRFRHILSGETHEIDVSSDHPVVVETIPGWAHDITNVGESVLISLLWANETFDPLNADTINARI